MLPLLAMHTLTLALLTMPKQIWRWKMIHHWLCTALSALSYREAKSFLKSLYPYCCKDRASYNWTSSLLSLIRVGAGQSNAAFLSDSIKNIHMEHILFTLCESRPKNFLQLDVEVFYSTRKKGLAVCKTCNETCLMLPQGAVNPLQWIEFWFICLGFSWEFCY